MLSQVQLAFKHKLSWPSSREVHAGLLQMASLAARLQEMAQEDYRVYHRVAAATRRGVSTHAHALCTYACCMAEV